MYTMSTTARGKKNSEALNGHLSFKDTSGFNDSVCVLVKNQIKAFCPDSTDSTESETRCELGNLSVGNGNRNESSTAQFRQV